MTSPLRDDVVEGLTSGFLGLPYWAVAQLGKCGLDVIGRAAERRIVANVSRPDHLVGAGEQRRWHLEAERLCGEQPVTHVGPLRGFILILGSQTGRVKLARPWHRRSTMERS